MIRDLHAFYGTAHVLFGVDLDVAPGASLAVLGRNGAGKTTLLRSVVQAGVRTTGSVRFGASALIGLESFRIARRGVQLVPEDRRVYSTLTVRENLEIATRASAPERPPLPLERVLAIFPTLEPLLGRRGNELSGGQQQLVAIARAVVSNPRLLLMDEPSAGLAPVVLATVEESIRRLRSELSMTVVVAEQNARFALALCEEVAVLEKGRLVFRGPKASFEGEEELQRRFLAV